MWGDKQLFIKKIAIIVLNGYKRVISPVLPRACRFHPTCSDYALQAIDKYGITQGGGMAVRRLLRCHPFHAGGYDPVP